MALIKCPRCELNYINEEEKICSVCRREVRGETEQYDMIELCSECGEHPVVEQFVQIGFGRYRRRSCVPVNVRELKDVEIVMILDGKDIILQMLIRIRHPGAGHKRQRHNDRQSDA